MRNAIIAAIVSLAVAAPFASAAGVTIPHGERAQNRDIATLLTDVARLQRGNEQQSIKIAVLRDKVRALEAAK